MTDQSPWANGHSIEVLRSVSAGLQPTVGDCRIAPVTVGGVAAEWVIANGVEADARVVLYFHGGAYLCGTPAQYRNATVWLSRLAGVRVLAVDYRLAPEHPFPSAFEDALAAYRWVCSQKEEDRSVVVAGDSAGASIAISVAMEALGMGLPAPAAVIANSPFADLTLASASLDDPALNRADPKKDTIVWLADTYLSAGQVGGEPVSARHPYHSPVYRNLAGMAPLLVQTAALDNLKDDGSRLAAQARRCGVATTFTEYADCDHIWIVSAPADASAASYRAIEQMSHFVERHLGATHSDRH